MPILETTASEQIGREPQRPVVPTPGMASNGSFRPSATVRLLRTSHSECLEPTFRADPIRVRYRRTWFLSVAHGLIGERVRAWFAAFGDGLQPAQVVRPARIVAIAHVVRELSMQ